ncbi:hypothetical protein SAY87_022914 [Trapa incisa]|uniref:Uncharacterized protein n=1 Tax=Trapa incisa TaxID=236973 RepID=A0AAN7Q5G9_9MYRT|nr:hypothetical protein SAY87_022914 [Trapa incisa]
MATTKKHTLVEFRQWRILMAYGITTFAHHHHLDKAVCLSQQPYLIPGSLFLLYWEVQPHTCNTRRNGRAQHGDPNMETISLLLSIDHNASLNIQNLQDSSEKLH